MKSYRELEGQLLSSSESIGRGICGILKNLGQAVAFVTAAVAVIITFTDVAFSTKTAGELLPSALALLVCSYIIYFSLEDAGEKLGEESEEYLGARKRFLEAKGRLSGDDTEGFCQYLSELCARELDERRRGLYLAYGISEGELRDYIRADRRERGKIPRQRRKGLEAIASLRAAELTPGVIFSEERAYGGSDLKSPERGKLMRLMLKMIPSSVCMLVTVSVALNIKADMTLSDVLNGILKLTALPTVGFRGYSLGYLYTKNSLSAWLSRKAEIIEGYLSTRDRGEALPQKCGTAVIADGGTS